MWRARRGGGLTAAIKAFRGFSPECKGVVRAEFKKSSATGGKYKPRYVLVEAGPTLMHPRPEAITVIDNRHEDKADHPEGRPLSSA